MGMRYRIRHLVTPSSTSSGIVCRIQDADTTTSDDSSVSADRVIRGIGKMSPRGRATVT
jgi:hypothetical protein